MAGVSELLIGIMVVVLWGLSQSTQSLLSKYNHNLALTLKYCNSKCPQRIKPSVILVLGFQGLCS